MPELSLKPVFNRVVIKRYEKEITKTGIILPDSARESLKMSQGEILAVGDEVQHLSPGDKIIWGKYGGCEIKRPEGRFVVMNDEDVIGIIDEYLEQ